MSDRRSTSSTCFATLFHDVAAQPDVDHTLESIVDLAVATVPGCEFAGVTIRRGRKLTTPAASSPVVDQADRLQYELAQGPCVDAFWVHDTYRVDDMATESRWPQWAPAAHRLGIASSLSIRLATPKGTVGSLNMYSKRRRAFDDDAVQIGHDCAHHAAAALAVAHEVSTLQSALQTRHTIGAAQGILRHRNGLTMSQAFTVLVRVSRNSNVPLRDLAQSVVDANGLPRQYLD